MVVIKVFKGQRAFKTNYTSSLPFLPSLRERGWVKKTERGRDKGTGTVRSHLVVLECAVFAQRMGRFGFMAHRLMLY